MQKRVIHLMSNKGGVGKSTLACATLEYLRKQNIAVAAFDLDPGVGSLSRIHGIKENGAYSEEANNTNLTSGVGKFDGRKHMERLGDAIDTKADLILFDYPGGLMDPSEAFGDMTYFKDIFQSNGYLHTVFIPVDPMKASSQSILEIMDIWGEGVDFFLFKNLGKGDADEFIYFDGDLAEENGAPAKNAVARGATVLNFPKLRPMPLSLADGKDLSFAKTIAELEKSRTPGRHAAIASLKQFLAAFDVAMKQTGLFEG